jgi:hypothetical protein
MAHSLTTLRKSPLLPILAVVASFFLVAGQVFNCCRLNETLSDNIGKALKGIGHWGKHPGENSDVKLVKTHPGCHGHPESDESQVTSIPLEDAPIQWKSAETCLSELDAAPKALQLPSNLVFDSFFSTSLVLEAYLVPSVPRFEKPRPQNKSSPPIYLLTLRLLV